MIYQQFKSGRLLLMCCKLIAILKCYLILVLIECYIILIIHSNDSHVNADSTEQSVLCLSQGCWERM